MWLNTTVKRLSRPALQWRPCHLSTLQKAFSPCWKPPYHVRSRPFARHHSTGLVYNFMDDDVENLNGYTKGGFHPVQIGDVLHDRYEVLDKLGHGGWSTVWLAHDCLEKQYVAVKVGIADSLPHEVNTLRALATSSAAVPGFQAIPRILDEFRVDGPNGSHPCYTTEPALCNLRESSSCCLFSLDVARALAYELTLAVSLVHSRGYVHGGMWKASSLCRQVVALMTHCYRYSSSERTC